MSYREPIWAAAQRAFAEGRLHPPPRRPTLRPESDYETDPAEAANFAEPQPAPRLPVAARSKPEPVTYPSLFDEEVS